MTTFRNFSNTTVTTALNGGITAAATSLVVDDGSSYPSADFTIRINNEIILVGSRSTNTFSSLTRGYDNTTAAIHADNDSVQHVVAAIDLGQAHTLVDDEGDNRIVIDGATGDIIFYKDDGSTIAGEWDQSENEFEWSTHHDFQNSGINGLQFLRMSSGPDASDYWTIEYTDAGDSISLRQWDNSAAGFLDRLKIIGKGTGVSTPGDIIFYDQDGAEAYRWDNALSELALGAKAISFNGPDASDLWEVGQYTDTFTIRQWDNSAGSTKARLEIIGTGAAVTNDGDIIFRTADGSEILRWDESQTRWQFAAGTGNRMDFAGGSSAITSVEKINSWDADFALEANGGAAAARDIRLYTNDATPTLQKRLEILGDGEINFFNSAGTQYDMARVIASATFDGTNINAQTVEVLNHTETLSAGDIIQIEMHLLVYANPTDESITFKIDLDDVSTFTTGTLQIDTASATNKRVTVSAYDSWMVHDTANWARMLRWWNDSAGTDRLPEDTISDTLMQQTTIFDQGTNNLTGSTVITVDVTGSAATTLEVDGWIVVKRITAQ